MDFEKSFCHGFEKESNTFSYQETVEYIDENLQASDFNKADKTEVEASRRFFERKLEAELQKEAMAKVALTETFSVAV